MRGVLVTWLCVFSVFAASPGAARADKMDLALNRLRLTAPDQGCTPSVVGFYRDYCPDQDAFQRLMSEMGGAIMNPPLPVARTVGPRGVEVLVDSWASPIDEDATRWQLGTEGRASDLSVDGARNRFPATMLSFTRVGVRKGLPFGFQLGTSLTHQWQSRHFVWGVDLQWALFEGYRTGWGMFPDVALRASVQTLTGDDEYNLTVPSAELLLSKPLVAGAMIFTPFVSAQWGYILADSELVDLSPERDAVAECVPDPEFATPTCTRAGPIPGEFHAAPYQAGDPQPVCLPEGTRLAPGDPVPVCAGDDFTNNAVFESQRLHRVQATVGLRAQYEAFSLYGAASYDVVDPNRLNKAVETNLLRQLRFTAGASLAF